MPPGTIEEFAIDDRANGHGERSGLPSHRVQTVDGRDPDTTGQRQALCRHVAPLLETTVAELPDLCQEIPLPFVNIGEHVRAISNRHRFRKNRHTQNVDKLQSNSEPLP